MAVLKHLAMRDAGPASAVVRRGGRGGRGETGHPKGRGALGDVLFGFPGIRCLAFVFGF